MHPEWKAFLGHTGAEFTADGYAVESFGNPEREKRVAVTGNILCDLSHLGRITVRGEDAATFLQGQLTNDLREIDPTRSQLTAYCSPKGRMLAIMLAFRRGDDYILQLPRERVAEVVKRLRLFVLRAQATLEEAADDLVAFGLAGPNACERLADQLGAAPEEPFAAVHRESLMALRLPGLLPRFQILGPLADARALWGALDVHAAPVGQDQWALLDVLSGVPQVYTETVESFVPQMTNLDLVNGVSFKKGCYPGQEVVARTHYLGRLKRRMYRLAISGERPLKPGTPVRSPSREQPVGEVVDARPHPDGGLAGLAVLQIDAVDSALYVGDDRERSAAIESLPYLLPSDQPESSGAQPKPE